MASSVNLRMTAVVLVAAAVFSCKKTERARPAPAAGVPVVVDGQTVARVDVAAGESRPLLDLLPAEHRDASKWALVHGVGRDGREILLAEPARDYPGDVIRVFRDAGGHLSLGALRPPRPDPWPAVGPLERIRIVTRAAAEAAKSEEAAGPEIAIEVRGQKRTVSAKALEGLAEVEVGNKAHRRTGWPLPGVLERAEIGMYESITVHAEDGALTYSRAELEAKTVILSVNRRGNLRLTEADAEGGEARGLRGVHELEVR